MFPCSPPPQQGEHGNEVTSLLHVGNLSKHILGTRLYTCSIILYQPKVHLEQNAHNLTALLETLSMSGILHAETHVALRKCGWTNTRSSTLLQDRLREDRTMESKWASQEGVCETVHYAGLTTGN